MPLEEKVWCGVCEEERWMRPVAGGYKCGVCLTYIPAEAALLAEHAEEEYEQRK